MMPKPGISTLVLFVTLMIVISGMATLGSPGAALAHDGHAHEGSGSGIGEIARFAATVAALVMLHVLATWFFRYRDRAHGAGKPETASPSEQGSGT